MPLESPFGRYLPKRGILLKDAGAFFEAETARIVDQAKDIAEQAGRPYVYREAAHTHFSFPRRIQSGIDIADQISRMLPTTPI